MEKKYISLTSKETGFIGFVRIFPCLVFKFIKQLILNSELVIEDPRYPKVSITFDSKHF